MKKKIAILLAAVLTATAVPMNVFAASSNSVSNVQNVKKDSYLANAGIKITPSSGVNDGSSILLTVENGEFPSETATDIELPMAEGVTEFVQDGTTKYLTSKLVTEDTNVNLTAEANASIKETLYVAKLKTTNSTAGQNAETLKHLVISGNEVKVSSDANGTAASNNITATFEMVPVTDEIAADASQIIDAAKSNIVGAGLTVAMLGAGEADKYLNTVYVKSGNKYSAVAVADVSTVDKYDLNATYKDENKKEISDAEDATKWTITEAKLTIDPTSIVAITAGTDDTITGLKAKLATDAKIQQNAVDYTQGVTRSYADGKYTIAVSETAPKVCLAKVGSAVGSTHYKTGDLTNYINYIKDLASVNQDPKKVVKLGTSARNNSTGFKRISSTQMEVTLGAIQGEDIGNKYYYIPLPIKATSEEAIKVNIDSNGTTISSGNYTVAKGLSSTGSTTTTASSVKTFNTKITLDTIGIREGVYGTLGNGTITLQLPTGFSFVKKGEYVGDVNATVEATVESGINSPKIASDIKVKYVDQRKATITLTGLDKTTKASSINIKNIGIIADDPDKNLGDVNLTITGDSNSGVSTETIKVATSQVNGFTFATTSEPTTVLAGRSNTKNSNLSEDKFVTAKIKFSEVMGKSWNNNRNLEFTVPEGVKIIGVKDFKASNFTTAPNETTSSMQIKNDGRTLTIGSVVADEAKTTSVEFKLVVSVSAGFTGDVTLAAKGAGAAESDFQPLVVAKTVSPFKIESKVTKANLGYQKYDTAEVKITENQFGAFMNGKSVKLKLTGVFGSDQLGFANDGIAFEVEGNELKIKNFKVDNNEITFDIDSESYKTPGAITIKNVKVGTTRSIPYGTFDLSMSGEGAINNVLYTNNGKDLSNEVSQGTLDLSEVKSNATGNDAVKQNKAVGFTNNAYVFKDYLTLVTETGTLDKVVKVSIGEKTVMIGDQTITMDVAPYIQSSSNSTMVPLRFVSVALGLDEAENVDSTSNIAWDSNSKVATIYYGTGTSRKIIQFQVGSNTMKIDGTSISMENGVKAELVDGRMFVPFRALGQAFGINVSWDADSRTAIYNGN